MSRASHGLAIYSSSCIANASHSSRSISCFFSNSWVCSYNSMTFGASPPSSSIIALASARFCSISSICCSTCFNAFCVFFFSLGDIPVVTLLLGTVSTFPMLSTLRAELSCSFHSEYVPCQKRGGPPSLGKTTNVSQTPSKRDRSWLTMITVPFHGCRSLSSESTVTASKSFVGSSRSKTFGRCDSTRSSCSRRASPPESMPTRECHRSCAKLTCLKRLAATCSRVLPFVSGNKLSSASITSSAISATCSLTVCNSSFHTFASCFRKPRRTESPSMRSPPSRDCSPEMALKSVLFPAPLGPITPTLTPRLKANVTASSIASPLLLRTVALRNAIKPSLMREPCVLWPWPTFEDCKLPEAKSGVPSSAAMMACAWPFTSK
mmetsp:Transcript_82488/g.163793  ORF Transcript_82488/g.163793 Transcript_82488/m.163793 type:complete len:379 (-) Transcript_82488:1168-2304(-)